MTKVVGFRHVDFVDRNGNAVKGDKIYFTDDSNPAVTGVTTDTVFIPDGKLKFNLSLGQIIDVRYAKFGKLDRVDLISDKR